jgi:hypothetical protein
MSPHDEFQDLKEQLRQNRPVAEPMPPALKNRLRHHLVEKAQMKQNPLNLGTLSAAVGLLILILLPALFWVWRSSLSTDDTISAVSGFVEDTPAAPATHAPAVAPSSLDTVEIIATYPRSGQPLDLESPTVWVMASYQLWSAEEAELSLRLTRSLDESSGVGVASASAIVTQTVGTVTLPLTLDPDQPADELQLNVLLRDPTSESERSLFLDFPQGYQWPAVDDQVPAQSEAVFLGVSLPEPYEDTQLTPAVQNYQVTAYVAYTLVGYERGVLTLTYQYHTESAGNSGTSTVHIEAGQDVFEFNEIFGPEYFNSDGSLVDEIEFSVELSGYDESTGEYRVIYPDEQVQASLQVRERLDIQSIAIGRDAAGQPELNVDVWLERKSGNEEELLVTLEDGSPDPLASGTQTISRQSDQVTVSLPVDLSQYPQDSLFHITATLEGSERTLTDELLLQAGAFATQRMNELWLISDEITSGESSSAAPTAYLLNLVIGYALDDEYSNGQVQAMVEVQSRGGGGGSGGGTRPFEPGVGAIVMTLPLPQSLDLNSADGWPEGLSMELLLTGRLADGTEQELFSLERGPGSS